MLTYAFDLLYAIYEEESYAPSEIPRLILTNNLYGTEIDPRAGALAAFALTMKARAKQKTFFSKQVDPNICVLEPIIFTESELDQLISTGGDRFAEEDFWNQFADADLFGALIQPNRKLIPVLHAHVKQSILPDQLLNQHLYDKANLVLTQSEFLSQRYHVVVANPPYMGSRNMSETLVKWLSTKYRQAKQDLYVCFIQRALTLGVRNAPIGMIVGDTWMSISSFTKFRMKLLEHFDFRSFVHLHDSSNHADIFGANAAFILSTREAEGRNAVFFSLKVNGNEAKESLFKRQIVDSSAAGVFYLRTVDMASVPGAPIAYALPAEGRKAFKEWPAIGVIASPQVGMQTSNNEKFIRFWWEIDHGALVRRREGLPEWLYYLKGGAYRRWWGNIEYVFHYRGDPSYVLQQPNATVLDLARADSVKVTWSDVSAAYSSRLSPEKAFHDIAGHCFYPKEADALWVLAYSNSGVFRMFLSALNSSVHAQVGDVGRIPVVGIDRAALSELASAAVEISKQDFNRAETSPYFRVLEIVELDSAAPLEERIRVLRSRWQGNVQELSAIEARIELLSDPTGITKGVSDSGRIRAVSLDVNPDHVYPSVRDPLIRQERAARDSVVSLVAHAVGVMFGRYSLHKPGLILADQGATLLDYLAKAPEPTFMPDTDNVIPIVDGDWFEDDVVGKFRQFLRVAFGEKHFEENLKFVVDSLGVKNLREYFVKSFYKDHVQRYKKRPIYWLFSSPKGSFNALVYLHRYNPSTVSTVLNDYLREYIKKLEVSLEQQERIVVSGSGSREVAVAQKESDRLRKVLIELADYERELYSLASQQIALDLDDGVLVNYQKFGKTLKDIGLKKGGSNE